MTTYTNQSKNTSSYTDQSKTPVIATNTYNSSYPYNSTSVIYNGAVAYSSFTNQSKNSSSYSNQNKS